jgi:hypothetical protein
VVFFFAFSKFSKGERWLFIFLILVELMTTHCLNFLFINTLMNKGRSCPGQYPELTKNWLEYMVLSK